MFCENVWYLKIQWSWYDSIKEIEVMISAYSLIQMMFYVECSANFSLGSTNKFLHMIFVTENSPTSAIIWLLRKYATTLGIRILKLLTATFIVTWKIYSEKSQSWAYYRNKQPPSRQVKPQKFWNEIWKLGPKTVEWIMTFMLIRPCHWLKTIRSHQNYFLIREKGSEHGLTSMIVIINLTFLNLYPPHFRPLTFFIK